MAKLKYQPFNPDKELRSLREFTPAEQPLPEKERLAIRKARRLEFERNLLSQKEGLAEVIGQLERLIKQNPDVSSRQLIEIVEAEAPVYRFSSEQLVSFTEVINKYRQNHETVKAHLNIYKDADSLFQACFGRLPRGRVEVIEGSMTITLRCFDFADYFLAASFFRTSGDENKLTEADKKAAKFSAGWALPKVKIPSLQDMVNIENASQNMELRAGLPVIRDESWSKQVQRHEDQHQFNKLFQPIDYRLRALGIVYNAIKRQHTVESATKEIVHNLVRQWRQALGVDAMVRDEILAYYKQGVALEKIYEILTKNPLYDYLEKFKNEVYTWPNKIVKSLKENLQIIISEPPITTAEGVESQAKWIESVKIKPEAVGPVINSVFKNEYEADLKKWLNSVLVLFLKNYEKEEILHLLSVEPVNNWPRLAQRMKRKE